VDPDALPRLARAYAVFGTDWAVGTSPLYEEWSLGIADDAELLMRLAALPPRLQQPNLLYAAARWEGAPLEPFAALRPWLLAHWDAVVATASVRSTQTNEPGRSATTTLALARLDGPIALLETGTAAGLCLYPDRFSYAYETPEGVRTIGGDRPRLVCRVDDAAVVPAALPDVVWRAGIDLSPLDAADPDALAWLETLVWPGPDHDRRIAGLRAAAEIARADPPTIVRGDILDTVADVAAESPRDATLVVFHSAVLMYLQPGDRERFAHTARTLGDALDRRVVWLSNESQGVLPAVDAQLPAGLRTSGRLVQSIDGRPVALAGQHGAVYESRAFRP
jgi:hypothetical protein